MVAHVLSQIREARAGGLYVSDFNTRMTGTGPRAELLARRFELACNRLGLKPARGNGYQLEASKFRLPSNFLHQKAGDQLRLL